LNSNCDVICDEPRNYVLGAAEVGAEDLLEKIKAGDVAFTRCIATPDMMPLVGRVAKVLGEFCSRSDRNISWHIDSWPTWSYAQP
jgi:hypothetical protein